MENRLSYFTENVWNKNSYKLLNKVCNNFFRSIIYFYTIHTSSDFQCHFQHKGNGEYRLDRFLFLRVICAELFRPYYLSIDKRGEQRKKTANPLLYSWEQ